MTRDERELLRLIAKSVRQRQHNSKPAPGSDPIHDAERRGRACMADWIAAELEELADGLVPSERHRWRIFQLWKERARKIPEFPK